MTPPRDALLQMIQQNDEKHAEAHRRLRQDLDKLEDQVNQGFESLREKVQANKAKIEELERSPVDAMKLVLTPRIVASIIFVIIGIFGGFWASTYGLRSDVRDILTRMESQKSAMDNAMKIQEMQVNMLRTAVDDMKKRQELKQYDVQDLKDMLMSGRAKTR